MMAESLDDGEFWLPPQFLSDDEIFIEKNDANVKKSADATDVLGSVTEYGGKTMLPFEFPYGFGSFNGFISDLGSPVESVVGSTETESDEEDYLAGLTRQMARSTLEDEYRGRGAAFGAENTKGSVVSGSPESTLCSVGNGCGCRQGSGHGSPNGPLRVSSPSATWDLLYAAAGEVAKLRMNQESHQSRIHLDLPRKQPSIVSLPVENSLNFDGSLYRQQSLSYQKLQESQFQHLRHHQMIKQQQKLQIANGAWIGQLLQDQTVVHNNRGRNTVSPLGLSSSAWPPLQQTQQRRKTDSDMRAVFVGNPSAKRESTGTGVFLPRRVGPPAESRKKPGSTVLLPARVVQALNLNLDDLSGPQHRYAPRFPGNFNTDGDAAFFRLRDDNVLSHQKSNILGPQPVMMNNNEVRLPQEWTY